MFLPSFSQNQGKDGGFYFYFYANCYAVLYILVWHVFQTEKQKIEKYTPVHVFDYNFANFRLILKNQNSAELVKYEEFYDNQQKI